MNIFYTRKGDYQKDIFIGRLAIYTRSNVGNEVRFYLFHIPIWKKIYSSGEVKHYLGGIRIAKFLTNNKLSREEKKFPTDIYLSKVLFKMHQISLEREEKLRIHFLYIADSYWPSWQSLYESCLVDKNIEVKVIFLNTKSTQLFSSQYIHSEKFLQDNNIPYIDYQNYMPEIEKPHVLIYQTPYNINYGVFKKVRPDSITALGIRVVYISYGIEYDRSIHNEHIQNLHYSHLVHTFAWRLFVMHHDIKEGFYDNCPSGGFHVCVSGHPKFDCYFAHSLTLPPACLNNAKKRKIIAFQIHCYNDSDCRGEKRIHSIPFREHLKILKLLKTYTNYFFVYTIHPAFKTRNIDKKYCTREEYFQFIAEIKNAENMYLYTGNHQALLANADAFITENSSLMIEMAYFNKSILYLYDYPIALKPFAEKLATTFHHGHTHRDVENFMNNIVFKKDDLLDVRKVLRESIFPKNIYDGHIGFRIKEYLIKTIQKENK